MLKLPGKKDVTPDEMLDLEVVRQLKIMKENDPGSQEYKQALSTYKELKDISHKEKKLKSSKYSRVFDALVTIGLFIGTSTVDYWTPITSRWGNTFMRRFRHDDDVI